MYQVMQWVKSTSLAEKGFDLDQIETILKAHQPPAWATEKLGEAGLAELVAMNELANSWRRMDLSQFRETMTTAHFDVYFADAISRAFLADYTFQAGQWQAYTYPDSAPDFRDVDRFRMTEPGTLFRRREKAENKASHISDSEVSYGVDEFGRQFDVSWRVIMNDDLGKIRETPRRMLNAVRRFEDSFVSALYDNATTQAALIALGAAYAGTGRLTAANLAIGLNAMRMRSDAAGNPIQINKIWLVIPPTLEMQAQVILGSTLMPGVATNDKNVLPQFLAGYKVDPYIATAAPNIPWYLFADPGEIPGVPVVRLQGWGGPLVSQKRSNIEVISGSAPAAFLMGSFESGDIEYMVNDVIGGWDSATWVGLIDPNAVYYSSGTAP
jgi:hypothetical protein